MIKLFRVATGQINGHSDTLQLLATGGSAHQRRATNGVTLQGSKRINPAVRAITNQGMPCCTNCTK
jgi:hypothetical protein